jgi:hypothetical protein
MINGHPYLERVAEMLVENKGVIDNRERPDSILSLCSLCVPLMMLYKLDLSSIQTIEFVDH